MNCYEISNGKNFKIHALKGNLFEFYALRQFPPWKAFLFLQNYFPYCQVLYTFKVCIRQGWYTIIDGSFWVWLSSARFCLSFIKYLFQKAAVSNERSVRKHHWRGLQEKYTDNFKQLKSFWFLNQSDLPYISILDINKNCQRTLYTPKKVHKVSLILHL